MSSKKNTLSFVYILTITPLHASFDEHSLHEGVRIMTIFWGIPTLRNICEWATELVYLFLASTFGAGFVRKGGELLSSCVALVGQFVLLWLGVDWYIPFGITLGSFALGLAIIARAERINVDLNTPYVGAQEESIVRYNQPETTLDEFHGQLLAGMPVWILPGLMLNEQVGLLVSALLWFRLFDTAKLWPIKVVEKRWYGTSFGILVDDTIAGLSAAGMVVVISLLF